MARFLVDEWWLGVNTIRLDESFADRSVRILMQGFSSSPELGKRPPAQRPARAAIG